MLELQRIFENLGGWFVTPPDALAEKLGRVKALVFDWDGVFNDGVKDDSGSSTFSEVDSMGTNLLRFGLWLHQGRMPAAAIITGVQNGRALDLVGREHFHAGYVQAKHKVAVLEHFLNQHGLHPHEVAFFFDDALDLSVAAVVGVRILVKRSANPLFTNYVLENNLADYVTGHESGRFAVREGCELLLGLLGRYDEVMAERLRYFPLYDAYYAARQAIVPQLWRIENQVINPYLAEKAVEKATEHADAPPSSATPTPQ
jgi:3-deoxy-D-manno-octulosonate 8-phosphate phosphatase (KDO 8-P phosphatase)